MLVPALVPASSAAAAAADIVVFVVVGAAVVVAVADAFVAASCTVPALVSAAPGLLSDREKAFAGRRGEPCCPLLA